MEKSLLVIAAVFSCIYIEVSSTPLFHLGDFASPCDNQQPCSMKQFFNTTSCKCECFNRHTKCSNARLLFNTEKCSCACPTDKVRSNCAHKGLAFDQEACDCTVPFSVRKARTIDTAPPPPPPPPPPPAGLCALPPSNCTDLKVLNVTSCQCECTMFLPAMECPTPRPRTGRTNTHTHTHTHTHSRRRNYEIRIGEDGCPELTPKGNNYKRTRVRNPRRTRSKKTKGTKGTKSSKSGTPEDTSAPVSSLTPVASCPEGQTPNYETCECMRQMMTTP